MNAIRRPATEDGGFASQVFGQDRALRDHVLPALQATPLWARLAFLAGHGPGASAAT